MAARFAWVLNLDADVELAAIASGAAGARTGYSPKQSVTDAMRMFVPKLAAHLLDPEIDLLIDERSTPLSAKGLIGRSFCPTPRALRLLARAGATPEAHPDVDVILRMNSRAFCTSLGPTLPGATFITNEDHAKKILSTRPPSAIATAWRVKRNFGMTGRGQRIVDPGHINDSDLAFVRAGLSEGGVQIEPNVTIISEFAIHGMIETNGDVAFGPVVLQRCDARGAWLASEKMSASEAPPALLEEAERVATALRGETYFGPFGVDAFTYENGGAISFQSRSEINARFTMGFAAPRS